MLKHEWFHFVILRDALSVDSRCEPLGRATAWGNLGNVIRGAGLDANGREPMDALMQLYERKAIILKKIHYYGLRFFIFEYSEYPAKNEFFWGEFGLFVTHVGSAYFHELEAKVYAAMQAATPVKQTKIGFHT